MTDGRTDPAEGGGTRSETAKRGKVEELLERRTERIRQSRIRVRSEIEWGLRYGPIMLFVIGSWLLAMNLGVGYGLAPDVGALPLWYVAAGILVPIGLAWLLRSYISVIIGIAIVGWIGHALLSGGG